MNIGIRRIGVITQYKSHSLLRHLQRGWAFLKTEMNEFVDLLPAQQRVDEESWYRGTADAVYQNQDILAAYRADYVVVLAGDHIYKQNYALMLADHVALGKEVTVGCIEVPREEATRLRRDGHRRAAQHPRLRREAGRAAGDAGQARPRAGQHGHLHLQRALPVPRARARHGRPELQPRLRQGHHPEDGALPARRRRTRSS